MLLSKQLLGLAGNVASGIEFIGDAYGNAITGGPISLTIPVDAQEGDMAFVVAGNDLDVGHTLPVGFIPVQSQTYVATINRGSWYKYLDTSDIAAGTITVTPAGTEDRSVAAMWVYRDADVPIVKAIENIETGNSSIIALNSADTTINNHYIAVAFIDDDKAVSTTYPTSFTDQRFIQWSNRQATDYSFSIAGAIFKETADTTISGENFTTITLDSWRSNIYEIRAPLVGFVDIPIAPRIVAVGGLGEIQTIEWGSTTAITRVSGTAITLTDVCWDGTYFYAIEPDVIHRSSDGITWYLHKTFTGLTGSISYCNVAIDGSLILIEWVTGTLELIAHRSTDQGTTFGSPVIVTAGTADDLTKPICHETNPSYMYIGEALVNVITGAEINTITATPPIEPWSRIPIGHWEAQSKVIYAERDTSANLNGYNLYHYDESLSSAVEQVTYADGDDGIGLYTRHENPKNFLLYSRMDFGTYDTRIYKMESPYDIPREVYLYNGGSSVYRYPERMLSRKDKSVLIVGNSTAATAFEFIKSEDSGETYERFIQDPSFDGDKIGFKGIAF